MATRRGRRASTAPRSACPRARGTASTTSGTACCSAAGTTPRARWPSLAGGLPAATGLMTSTARALGRRDTVVVNTSGLDARRAGDERLRPRAVRPRAAARPRRSPRLVRTKTYAFPSKGTATQRGRKTYQIQNHDLLLVRLPGRHRRQERLHDRRGCLLRRQRPPRQPRLRRRDAARAAGGRPDGVGTARLGVRERRPGRCRSGPSTFRPPRRPAAPRRRRRRPRRRARPFRAAPCSRRRDRPRPGRPGHRSRVRPDDVAGSPAWPSPWSAARSCAGPSCAAPQPTPARAVRRPTRSTGPRGPPPDRSGERRPPRRPAKARARAELPLTPAVTPGRRRRHSGALCRRPGDEPSGERRRARSRRPAGTGLRHVPAPGPCRRRARPGPARRGRARGRR